MAVDEESALALAVAESGGGKDFFLVFNSFLTSSPVPVPPIAPAPSASVESPPRNSKGRSFFFFFSSGLISQLNPKAESFSLK